MGWGDAVVLGARLGRRPDGGAPIRRGRGYLRDGDRVFETYWSTGRGTEAGASSYHLLDLTVYGRQETWEDSPDGWPQPNDPSAAISSAPMDGPPRSGAVEAGRSDDLTG